MKKETKKTKLIFLIMFLSFLILSMIFAYMYVYNEDNVYVYDYVGYQLRANYLTELFQTNFSGALSYLFTSIANFDYNLFPVFPLVPILILAGKTRITYIIAMTTLYVVPTMFLLFYIIIKQNDMEIIFDKKKTNFILLLTIFICIFCFTGFWSPTLRGLPDIIGVIPLYLIMYLISKYDFTKKVRVQYSFIFGLLAYLPFLCRRWYAYAVVALYVSYFIICFIQFIKSNNKKTVFINCLLNFMIAGITTLFFLLLLQLPLVKVILNETYSEAYSAFQYTLSGHINSFIGEYGLAVLVFMIIGIIYGIFNEKNRIFVIYSFLNIIIFVFLFTRTQGMGVHHYLGISPYVIYLCIMGIISLFNHFKKSKNKILFCMTIILIFELNFSTTYIFRNKKLPLISQNNTYYKFRYENYNNLTQFVYDLSNLIYEDYGKVSSFASSEVISDSLIDTIGDENISNNLIYSSIIDLRDGLNFNSLINKYVIVTDKVQANMNPDKQQTLVIPNEMIYKNDGIGKSYQKVLGPYKLANEVSAYVYKKINAISENDVTYYLDYFYKLYPDWKNNYYLFDKFMLMSYIDFGTNIGEVKKLEDNLYYISPGYTPTIIKSKMFTELEKIKLNFFVDNNIPKDEKCGVVNLKIEQNNKVLYEGTVDRKNSLTVDIDKNKGDNITFSISYGENFSYDFLYMKVEKIN